MVKYFGWKYTHLGPTLKQAHKQARKGFLGLGADKSYDGVSAAVPSVANK
jgi:hypothetical protein